MKGMQVQIMIDGVDGQNYDGIIIHDIDTLISLGFKEFGSGINYFHEGSEFNYNGVKYKIESIIVEVYSYTITPMNGVTAYNILDEERPYNIRIKCEAVEG